MKRIKILAYALIAVTMGTTATLNVNKVMKANKTVDYSTTTLTAMGENSYGEDGIFTCKTYTTLVWDEYYNCSACGNYHKRVTSETYECNKGSLPVGSCYTGYKHFYYDCQNNVSKTLDMTESYLCTLY